MISLQIERRIKPEKRSFCVKKVLFADRATM